MYDNKMFMNSKIVAQMVKEALLKKDNSSRVLHAAAVVYKGRIISIATNGHKSHPIQKLYGRNRSDSPNGGERSPCACHNTKAIYLHAEVHAMIKAYAQISESKFRRSSLYVIRINKESGELMFSKPCDGCMEAIDEFGINKIYHS